MVPAAWDFEATARDGHVRQAFRNLISSLSAATSQLSSAGLRYVDRTISRALAEVEQRGQPWVLTEDERTRVARLPFLRATFLLHGKLQTHDPLLDPADLLRVGLPQVSTDWATLLSAAMTRQSPELFAALVTLAAAFPTILALPANPSPNLQVPSVADGLLQTLVRVLTLHSDLLPRNQFGPSKARR
jgi:hypothetical protein